MQSHCPAYISDPELFLKHGFSRLAQALVLGSPGVDTAGEAIVCNAGIPCGNDNLYSSHCNCDPAPANVQRKAADDAEVEELQPPTWGTRMKFLAAGFDLTQLWLLCSFGE